MKKKFYILFFILGIWHVAAKHQISIYVHCPQKTTVQHITGNGFIQSSNECVLKTDTQILQNYKNSQGNMTFKFVPEENFTFDISELSNLKALLASNEKMNNSNPLNLGFKDLIKRMNHSEFKQRMLTFHNDYKSDSFMQKYVLNPTIMAVFVLLFVALMFLCFKKNKWQVVNSN